MLNLTFTFTHKISTYCKHTHTDAYSPETESGLGGVHPFMILHSLNGAAILACLPRGLSRAEGWVSNHVCVTGNRQAYWLSIKQPLYFLSPFCLSVCISSLFTVSFFSQPVSSSSLTSKRFSLTSERENQWEGGVRASLSPFTIPSLPHTHTHTLCLICLKDS